jgi:N-acetylmuramoyl-L-alanine amidase
MKSKKAFRFVAVAAAATIGVLSSSLPAISVDFDATEVDQGQFLSVAIPGGSLIPYQLWLIRENQPGADCFEVSGTNPGVVEPLWRGNSACGTSSDSNGYSIRVNDEDLGTGYSLSIKESNGELVLLGQPLRGSSFIIGRTGGISPTGYTEIKLEPGWRITQRSLDGRLAGHYYYTNDATLAELESGEGIATGPSPTPTPLPEVTYPFPDIASDIYAREIALAADLGIVAGGDDGRFGPERPVTREEAASIVVEALLTKGDIALPTVTRAPFPDVAPDRWSAPKIALLVQEGILTGYPDGTFRPTASITRAELMSVLRRAGEAVAAAGGAPERTIEPTGEVFQFSDIDGHWNEQTIETMSAYCGVATPYNERGSEFRPNANALRNYTTAAVVRLVDCGATPVDATVPAP